MKEYYDYSPISTCTKMSWYFLRNNSDCKDENLYNTKKRYAVIKSSDLTRNISWLASCFFKIKKPNKHFPGNQSVIAGVHIFDTIAASMRTVFQSISDSQECPLGF